MQTEHVELTLSVHGNIRIKHSLRRFGLRTRLWIDAARSHFKKPQAYANKYPCFHPLWKMYKVLFPQDFIPAKRYTSYLNPAGQIEVRSHWLVLCRLCLLTSGRCVESVVYCASRSAEQMQWTERVSRELWHYTLCSKAKGRERGRFSTAPLGSQCTLYQTERLALWVFDVCVCVGWGIFFYILPSWTQISDLPWCLHT